MPQWEWWPPIYSGTLILWWLHGVWHRWAGENSTWNHESHLCDISFQVFPYIFFVTALSLLTKVRLVLAGNSEQYLALVRQCLTLSFYFQLILYLSFSQAVKLHSMRIKGPSENGPKTIKLFINQPHTIDFDTAESANPVQELTYVLCLPSYYPFLIWNSVCLLSLLYFWILHFSYSYFPYLFIWY